MVLSTQCNGNDIARGRRHSSDRSTKWRLVEAGHGVEQDNLELGSQCETGSHADPIPVWFVVVSLVLLREIASRHGDPAITPP